MSKASFVRKVNFQSSSTGFALVSAVFYEDEKRVYAFLRFRNNSTSHVRGCTLRVTPYDSDRKPMQGFGARIDDLELPVNREVEYPSPLLLRKDTFAFNWSFYEIEYSNPDKVKNTGTAVSNTRQANAPVGNVSAEAQLEAEAESVEKAEEAIAVVTTPLDDTIAAVREIPVKKIRLHRASKGFRFGLFVPIAILAGLTTFVSYGVSACEGDFLSFLSKWDTHLTYIGAGDNSSSTVNNSTDIADSSNYKDGRLVHLPSVYNTRSSITIPDQTKDGYEVWSIGGSVFANIGTSYIYGGKNLKEISSYAFFDCLNLYSVSLGGNGTLSLLDNAFCNCTSLYSLKFNCPVVLDGMLRTNTNQDEMRFECETLSSNYTDFIDCSEVKLKFTKWANPEEYLLRDSATVSSFYASSATYVNIPANFAYGASALKEVELRLDYVTSLRNETFAECHQLSTFKGYGIDSLGSRAFAGCHNLYTAYLPSCTVVASDAFEGCDGLKYLTVQSGCSIDTSSLPSGCEVTYL